MKKNLKQVMLKFAETLDGELLQLPLQMLMQTIFLGGNKGSGKTSAMKRLFEAAYRAGAQCGVIAPLGKWWSLRVPAKGRGKGLNVVVFGGRFGDVPLVAGSGRTIARVVVQKKLHFVLDVEAMRKAERAVFLTEFMEELIQLKKAEKVPAPFVLFSDETQSIAPQKSTSKEVEKLRELMGDFARECRNYGAGLVLSAQRSANVDKDLLALCEMLVVMRTVHHLDRTVYKHWVDEKGGDDEDDGAWLRKLRRLSKGEAYVYAPEFNIFQRARIFLPDTFDATKTAVLGAKLTKVGRLSKLDVRKLSDELTAVITTAAANDPSALRAKVVQLELHNKLLAQKVDVMTLQLKSAKPAKAVKPPKPNLRAEKRLVKQGKVGAALAKKIEWLVDGLKTAGFTFEGAANKLRPGVVGLMPAAHRAMESRGIPSMPVPAQRHPLEARGAAKFEAFKARGAEKSSRPDADAVRLRAKVSELKKHLSGGSHPEDDANERSYAAEAQQKLGKGERIVMRCIAQHPNGVTREQITVTTGYKRSTRDAYVARLIAAGFVAIEYEGIRATNDGIAWLGTDYAPLPTGAALREHWLKTLPSGECRILGLLVTKAGFLMTREALGDATGFKVSTRNAYIARLLTRKLVVDSGGGIQASLHLFEGV